MLGTLKTFSVSIISIQAEKIKRMARFILRRRLDTP